MGVFVRSLEDGRTLYERNPDTALLPASNNKILTAAVALSRLGPDFRYTTTLYRTGSIAPDGMLSGDLWLRGTGDPSFASADLLAMGKTLRAQGVTRFAGRYIADASRFPDAPLGRGWSWDDEAASYAPQISALSCDENVMAVSVAPAASPGLPPVVTLGGSDAQTLGFAGTKYVAVRNTATTVPSGTAGASVSLDRPRAQNLYTVSGSIAMGAAPVTDWLTIEDPDVFTATRLSEVLPLAGVAVPGPWERRVGRGTVPADAVVVAEKRSEPLSVLVRQFLKPSDNLYGELLLRTLGAEKGRRGTSSAGAAVVGEFLREIGADEGGWFMADGSGLSREDTVTARLLLSVLTHMDRKAPAPIREAFYNGLPIGGVDGTIRNRFKGTPAQNNVHAKTGSISRVSSLSGYVTTKAGERLVFSILMNNFSGPTSGARAAQDRIVLALLDAPKS